MNINPNFLKILRWVARIWSTSAYFFQILLILRQPNANWAWVWPVTFEEWIELGLSIMIILGLYLAWFREGLGGAVAILAILVYSIAFRVFRGYWIVIPTILFLGIPAILFLIYWVLSKLNNIRSEA